MDHQTLRTIQGIVAGRGVAPGDRIRRPRGDLRRDGRVAFTGRDGRRGTRPQAVLRPHLVLAAWPASGEAIRRPGPFPLRRTSSTLVVTVVNRGAGPAHNAVVRLETPAGSAGDDARRAITLPAGATRRLELDVPLSLHPAGVAPPPTVITAFDPLTDPLPSTVRDTVAIDVGNLLDDWSFDAGAMPATSWSAVPAAGDGEAWVRSRNCVEVGGVFRPDRDRSLMATSATPTGSSMHQVRTIVDGAAAPLHPFVRSGDVLATLDGWCWSADVRHASPRIILDFMHGSTVLESVETATPGDSQSWTRFVVARSVPPGTTRLRTRLVDGRSRRQTASGFDRIHLTLSHRHAIATHRLTSY